MSDKSISWYLTKNGSDKCTSHSYQYLYDSLLTRWDRNSFVDILESGVEYGGSLSAWKEYFPNARVTGVDIVDARKEELKRDDVEFVLSDIKEYTPNRKFDLIIEDGNHSNFDCLWAATNLPKYLKDNGVLVIEDVQEGYAVPFLLWGNLGGKYAVSTIDLRRQVDKHDDFMIVITPWVK